MKNVFMSDLPYRKGANAIVLDSNNNFLLVQKQQYGENQWDFPGGGIEDGEEPKVGILRELEEELGSINFEIIRESPLINRFEWPKEAQDINFAKSGKRYKGQEKFQFIVRFTGNRKDMITQKEELRKIKWVPYSELKNHLIFEGQWENVKEVLKDFGINS